MGGFTSSSSSVEAVRTGTGSPAAGGGGIAAGGFNGSESVLCAAGAGAATVPELLENSRSGSTPKMYRSTVVSAKAATALAVRGDSRVVRADDRN